MHNRWLARFNYPYIPVAPLHRLSASPFRSLHRFLWFTPPQAAQQLAAASQLKRVAATDPRTGLPTVLTSPLAPIAIGPSPTHVGGSKGAPGSPAAATSAAGALWARSYLYLLERLLRRTHRSSRRGEPLNSELALQTSHVLSRLALRPRPTFAAVYMNAPDAVRVSRYCGALAIEPRAEPISARRQRRQFTLALINFRVHRAINCPRRLTLSGFLVASDEASSASREQRPRVPIASSGPQSSLIAFSTSGSSSARILMSDEHSNVPRSN